MNNFTSKGDALITGGSTGIGLHYARQLAHRGFDVILASNNPARIYPAISKLTRETGRSFEIISADLGTLQGMRDIVKVLDRDASISLLVNHCDVESIAPLNGTTAEDMNAMVKINMIAMEYFSVTAIPHFINRGTGAIINIASIVTFYPECFDDPYDFLKNNVISYSEKLRHLFSLQGVYVQTALLGTSSPDFWNTHFTQDWSDGGTWQSADFLIGAALADFDNKLPVTAPSLDIGPHPDL